MTDLFTAARDFYNMTVADTDVRITTADKDKRDTITAASETLRAALSLPRQSEADPVAWSVLQVGNYGAAYDSPGTKRAYTYDHQPGNVDASKLGRATDMAAVASAGDSIDRGLSLLKTLQENGFGVFQIGQPESIATTPQPAQADTTPAAHGVDWRGLWAIERTMRLMDCGLSKESATSAMQQEEKAFVQAASAPGGE